MIRNRFSTRVRVSADVGPLRDGKAVSRTKQSFKDECDINQIMKRFEKTGQLPDMIKNNPQYGDFSEVVEYQEACNIVLHAQEQFAALSARVRERFANNPENFLKFATDPRNGEEMVKLGLATKRPTKTNVDDMGGGSEGASAPRKRSAPKAEPKKEEAAE